MDGSANQSSFVDSNGMCDSSGSVSPVPASDESLLFINDEGEPLSFILSMRNYMEIEEYTKLIEDHFGVVKKLRDFGDYDAVLVHDRSGAWSHTGDNFKVSYIKDCIKKGEILNISDYRFNANSNFVDSFNYMDIIYKRKYTWTSVPQNFLKVKKGPSTVSQSVEDRLLEDDEVSETSSSHRGGVDKWTKSLFSASEKRKMVEYIFKKKDFDQLKGNNFWKKMESDNVCPIRTWQSMKNHFVKSLAFELDAFNLNTADLKEFRKWYFHKAGQRNTTHRY